MCLESNKSFCWPSGTTGRNGVRMNKQTIQFAVNQSDGILKRVSKSYIAHPDIKFSGKGIKWYKDKLRRQYSNKNG